MDQDGIVADASSQTSRSSTTPSATASSLTGVAPASSASSSSIPDQAQHHHPLSPSAAPSRTKPSSSYLQPSPSLLTGASNGLFKDVEDAPEDAEEALEGSGDEPDQLADNDRSIRFGEDIQTPRGLAASADLRLRSQSRSSPSQTTWMPVTIRLPRPPHLLSPLELKRRLDEQQSDAMALALVQETSRQLTEALTDLAIQQARQTAREEALLKVIRESAGGGNVTEGMVERALLRATSEATEAAKQSLSAQNPAWKATFRLPKQDSPPKHRTNGKAPLSEDLQDAMSETEFRDFGMSASPSSAVNRRYASPHGSKTSSIASPGVGTTSIQERRGRQSSTSLSTRWFGSFSPSSASHFSPTVGNFASGSSATSSTQASPAQPIPVVSKPRADSIRSVQSNSSVASHAQKGITGWAGSFLGWKQPSGSKQRFTSDSEDEEETGSRCKSSTPKKSSDDRASVRPRSASKSSASARSFETTGAPSISSQLQATSADDTGYSSPTRAGSPLSRSNMQSNLSIDEAIGKRQEQTDPARTLLQRRSSAQHSSTTLNTEVLPVPVSATQCESGSSLPYSTSADLLHSISMSHMRQLTLEVPETSHFRAVSESASTLGKSGGKLVGGQVFRAPNKVSKHVSDWTQRLLLSFKPPSPMEGISRSASGSSISRDGLDPNAGATDLPRRRSRSPRLAVAKSKAALSPAVLQSDATSTTVRLLATSPTEELATSPFEAAEEADEAMPLATKTVKQKGYLASAKGTIGRALGYSSTSKTPTSTSSTSKEKRRNSLKTRAEPTLTLPETFISFSASATSSLAPTPVSGTYGANALKAPKSSSGVLEMGTIVAPEAKPPTLSSDLAEQMKDGPLVDRFGFVYDVKAGMKLLREARSRQQNKEEIMNLDSPPEINVDELKEALGPSPAPTPGVETALTSAAMQLSRSDDSNAPAMEQAPSNQSIRRLLSQLGEMNETVEKAQKDGWDAFIKRRKSKANKAKTEEDLAKKKRKPAMEAPLGMGQPIDDLEQEQFTDHLVGVASMGSSKEDDKTFRQLVKAGVPIVYRCAIWAEVSGASELREPGVYQDLLARHAGENTSCLEQIDMDTHRTFPTNVFFAGNGPGVIKLRRVLIAYSWRDPSIGYCQGMNLLAALLLLVYPDEEDAFWMLSSMLERVLPSDYYSSQLLVSQADQRVLQDLIQLALPDLHAHLEDLGVDLPAITFGWFLSLFTDALPIHTLLRVWDVLLVFGPITLFKIAIAIFRIHSAEIFATDSASSFYVLVTSLTSHMYGADKLIKVAFEDLRFIKRHDIEKLRLKHVAAIERELQPNPHPPSHA